MTCDDADDLHGVTRRLPTDFEPYGTREREPSAFDCSAGCRWFLRLDGELGYDWGVCCNARSPRAGLLTFEHQGCAEFEAEGLRRATTVFVVQHAHPWPDEPDRDEEVEFIGAYSRRETAERAIERLRVQPGFVEWPDGFHVDEYALDDDHWTEGVVTQSAPG